MKHVTIYTDGSSPENALGHGRGGYCAILVSGAYEKVVSGALSDTTNNRAELMAVLEGIKALKEPCEVEVVTDSKLVIGWLSEGWKRKDFECAKISREIDTLVVNRGHLVTFRHVNGHSGDYMNERCDEIARRESGV